MRRIGFFAAVLAVLLALNWSKLDFAGASDGETQSDTSGTVKIDPQAAARVVPQPPTRINDSKRPPLSPDESRILEAKLSDYVHQVILDNRKGHSLKSIPNNSMKFQDIRDIKSRTSFLCGNAGCIFSANPGHDLASRELVATLVKLESGIKNHELAKIGLKPDKISSQRISKTDLQVNLTLLPIS